MENIDPKILNTVIETLEYFCCFIGYVVIIVSLMFVGCVCYITARARKERKQNKKHL